MTTESVAVASNEVVTAAACSDGHVPRLPSVATGTAERGATALPPPATLTPCLLADEAPTSLLPSVTPVDPITWASSAASRRRSLCLSQLRPRLQGVLRSFLPVDEDAYATSLVACTCDLCYRLSGVRSSQIKLGVSREEDETTCH